MALAAGCAKTGQPGAVKAGGRVTYKGQPVAGATVTFVPQSGKGAAVGMTDASGRFRLMTSGGEGALVGAYKATVTKPEQAGAGVASDTSDPESLKKADMAAFKPAAKPAAQPKALLPGKYATAGNTPLTYEVTDKGKNEFEIELVD
jgi:hypothetical protein